MPVKNLNTVKQDYKVCRADREKKNNHKAMLIWFTGLSGSGKSTLANAVEIALNARLVSTYTLDGDNVRQGINKDLGFSPSDRKENIRRIAEISNLMVDAGLVTLAAFVSPYREDREQIKTIVGAENVTEVYVNASLETCEQRDVKGLYKKARSGEIKNMTGIDAPYEAPIAPDIEIVTDNKDIKTSVNSILEVVLQKIKL